MISETPEEKAISRSVVGPNLEISFFDNTTNYPQKQFAFACKKPPTIRMEGGS